MAPKTIFFKKKKKEHKELSDYHFSMLLPCRASLGTFYMCFTTLKANFNRSAALQLLNPT